MGGIPMAVVTCKKCGAQYMKASKSCPACGTKRARKTSVLVWILAALFAIIFLKSCYSVVTGDVPPPKSQEALAEQAKSQEIDAALAKEKAAEKELGDKKAATVWAAKQSVKKILNDPDSAKFGKVVYREPGIVCGYINAKNGFGGYVGEKGFISLGTPEMTWLEGQSKDFESVWNKQCASK
jgi:hypothetical protein